MTMDFPVSDSMDLASVPMGERIAFLIRETGDSRYVIDAVEAPNDCRHYPMVD